MERQSTIEQALLEARLLRAELATPTGENAIFAARRKPAVFLVASPLPLYR